MSTLAPASPPQGPCVLALDTSTQRMAVALLWGEHALCATEDGGARASLRLLPLAQALLSQAGLAMEQLDAIAFGQGPGAFTGLRTATAAAQGLALGIRKPVLALDSLALVAEDALPHAQMGATVWVAMDARMDEIYAARYHRSAQGWQADEAPGLWPWAALAQHLAQAAAVDAVAGSAWSVFADRLPAPPGAQRFAQENDRGEALARLARQAWAHGPRLDAAMALPLYLRDKVAQTTAERMAAVQRAREPA
jgi:tRNA threonylcarbamoyladenosine biosynthesis protein TsaB